MKPTLRNTAAALAARYRSDRDAWFLGTRFAGQTVEMVVTEACPFRVHRDCAGVPVRVVVVGTEAANV